MKINIEDIHVQALPIRGTDKMLVGIQFEVDYLEVFMPKKNQRGLEAKLRDELYNIVKEL